MIPPIRLCLPPCRLGISACLLGQNVRWDGDIKDYPVVRELLHSGLELVPICPEVELGLGVPREAIQLEHHPHGIRLMSEHTRRDLTEAMESWARERIEALAARPIHGYIARAKSPSCGHGTTKLLIEGGEAPRRIDGLFMMTLKKQLPDLPIIDDLGLLDEATRGAFVEALLQRLERDKRSTARQSGAQEAP